MLWNIKHTDDYAVAKTPTFNSEGVINTPVIWSKKIRREVAERERLDRIAERSSKTP